MSIFNAVTVSCPSCGSPVQFEAVFSLNADRRPDLRDAVLNGSFQRQACSQCNTEFRLDPEMTYVDVARGLWIAAFPYAKLGQWKELEEQARATFNRAYGEHASAAAREIGAGMKARLTFGWAGLREKLVAADAGFDDVILELAKTALCADSTTRRWALAPSCGSAESNKTSWQSPGSTAQMKKSKNSCAFPDHFTMRSPRTWPTGKRCGMNCRPDFLWT